MSEQDTIAVIGAGAIGTAVAYALAREGRRVMLLDRDEPGVAGASFGNAGHIASELVQPLPSAGLLFGFYRELIRFGGVLDLPPHQVLSMLPWIGRFAAAAFRQARHTPLLAPLVRRAPGAWREWVGELGRPELLRSHGHYEIEFGRRSVARAAAQARLMATLGVAHRPMAAEQLLPLQRAANEPLAAGLWFPDSGHVIDPLQAVRAFTAAALSRNATLRRLEVRALRPRGEKIEVLSDAPALTVDAAVVCAGVGAESLLAPFGLCAPLQAVRGYHVEMQGHAAFIDAPVVYNRERVVVTPMAGRLRATSYMEFAAADAPADPRKPRALRRKIQAIGYTCAPDGPSWVGSRPVLPDYLPGIGRAPGIHKLFYAVGHQHIGLTLAPISADLMADIVAQRPPRLAVAGFDLRRFN